MKKIFTLLFAASAAMSATAEESNFVGTSTFFVPGMEDQTTTTTLKDTVAFDLFGFNAATYYVKAKLPSLYYAASNMTLPSFVIDSVSCTLDMTAKTITCTDQKFTTKATGTDGQAKDVAGTITVSYDANKGGMQLSATFSYGSMPVSVTYKMDGYHTPQNAWQLAGAGSEANPYKIYDAADFKAMAKNISGTNTGTGEYFVMMNDIDFGGSETNPVPLPAIGKFGIVNLNTVTYGFSGTFDGQSHSVTGIYHNNCEKDTAGMFNGLFAAITDKGIVRNVVMGASNYINSYWYAGAISSVCHGTIENCINYADITDTGVAAGGICGYLYGAKGTVKNCQNYGSIYAQTYAAGIVGMTQTIKTVTSEYLIDGCYNFGSVSTKLGTGASGIVGSYSGEIRNCKNYGTVTGSKQYTAGIIANGNYDLKISNCTNNGTITGTKYTAGILAYAMKGDQKDILISNCTNNGIVSGTSYVAGIFGAAPGNRNCTVTLDACANYAEISSSDAATTGNLRGMQTENDTKDETLKTTVVINDNCTIGKGLTSYALDSDASGIQDIEAAQSANTTVYDLYGRHNNGTGLQILNGRIIWRK